ncbi:MAG: enoyl-CoA hydratase/isomerase family protein, partial [Gammaproteobacteria bacterium]|nr:enoyl-CoA hydratase/isomerase family protein [Gammaproteobacteria bacterium]
MKDNYIVSNTENSVCEIQLNRPEKMNALTDDMYGELVRLLKLAETDDSIKSVIISSTNQHFTAGNDLA